MKTNEKSEPTGGQSACQSIRIEFHDAQAQEVCISGTFNDWNPNSTRMLKAGGGRWVKELNLPPGRYEYRLVVDGQWRCDPTASEKVSNSFGEDNCILTVPAALASDSAPRRRVKR